MNWSFAASPWIQALALALLGLVVAMGWTHYQRSGHRGSVLFLESLRCIIMAMLLFTLLQPEMTQTIARKDTPVIAILSDDTDSMTTKDVWLGGTNVMTRREWIDQTLANTSWEGLRKSNEVVVLPFQNFLSQEKNGVQGQGTDLNQVLESVGQRYDNLKALVLLSDGDWNQGAPPSSAGSGYREREIPIFSVAVGSESPLPDLVLDEVHPPSYGLMGEQISIPFKVFNHFKRAVETEVTLKAGQEIVERRLLSLNPLSEHQDAMVWSPTTEGDQALTLEVQFLEGEILADNNLVPFVINVRKESLTVLVVDSLPRWEYRFLRNALARDPGVEMHCLLFHPGMGTGGGRHYLSEFPNTKELISRYDVIFLGDVGVGENELTLENVDLIRGLVENQASGLVLIPGRRGRQNSLFTTPLEELFPVVLETNRLDGVSLKNETKLLLTQQGKRHFLTRFDTDGDRNEELWKSLPGFFWSASVEKSRPGSEVLAVHASLRNQWGRMPLLVTRPFGNGKVLFMGTDSAWRWRRGVEDKFHYRLWSQVVRWMAHQRHQANLEGIRLTYSPERPRVGDTVNFQATVTDENGFPVDDGPGMQVDGILTFPSGKKEKLKFDSTGQGWGLFESAFLPEEGGTHQFEVLASSLNRELSIKFEVDQPVIEKIGQPIQLAVLQDLADLSGGKTESSYRFDQILSQLASVPEPKPFQQTIRLWAHPGWGGSLLGLLTLYWVGRKWFGLV